MKKKGQYWVNEHLNWGGGGGGLVFFNNEKMLSHDLEYKINLSYGCKKNSGSCRFKHWLYDPPPQKKKKKKKHSNKYITEQVYQHLFSISNYLR